MAIVFIYECFETRGCGLSIGKLGIPLYGISKSHERDLKAMKNLNMFCLYQNPNPKLHINTVSSITENPFLFVTDRVSLFCVRYEVMVGFIHAEFQYSH